VRISQRSIQVVQQRAARAGCRTRRGIRDLSHVAGPTGDEDAALDVEAAAPAVSRFFRN
jgi:hypothetical protein